MFCIFNTSIIIEGNKDSLQAVANQLKQTGGELTSEIFASAELDEDDLQYCWYDDIEVKEYDGCYTLSIWLSIHDDDDDMGMLCPNFPPEVYFELHALSDDNVHWTNDAERRYFIYPYFIVAPKNENENVIGSFRTEEEAENFLKVNKDYFFYWHTTVHNACPPLTTKIINCLIDAINKQNEALCNDEE